MSTARRGAANRDGAGAGTAAERRDAAVAALRRIAFLLERAQASAYRSEAFRAAARSVEREDADRVVALATSGGLTDLPAVGARTAEVIALVVRGRPVEYLDRLEAEHAATQAAPVADAAAALRRRLRGDLHAHSEASDGATPIQEMVLAALELGHEYLAITDHSPRLTVANGLSAARLRAQLGQVAALNRAVGPFVVLSGIEVDILDDGGLDQDPDLLDELDVVVASVHSKLRMDRRAMTERMVAAVRNPRTDVLGHCTGRRLTGRPRPQSEFDAHRVFAECAQNGVAVEINCRPDRLDPPHDLLEVAVDAGCDFTIDTDAHAPGQLDWLAAGCERAAQHGIDPDRVLTTWPVERLRERTRP
ncbi:PHP domain-containing protein [Cellulomonas fimi]|uniref:PHP domain protein n=1 Tax=Cellulomonas fimi (strain ATCC 484 / DSM 20113 / JCM 1341 / CCUG 24087 / LMG 16345 / NBRC 15513 / NCIMB 8980 / NCTC 7547 / NRS-133) TaxID=590998 RepID=F4GZK5_CELFA|nr:PHP domain-containing protein [Cellulomonas fimi]AEE46049.1 PHP domain protein [Cellulomonas fimi ATCC 484]VEH31428.1 DNA polymerase/3'-5' exonuclease PolX [Cellulomonas fimi]